MMDGKGFGRWPNLRYYGSIRWRDWGKLRKTSIGISGHRGQYLNQGTPEYEGVLNTRPWRSLVSVGKSNLQSVYNGRFETSEEYELVCISILNSSVNFICDITLFYFYEMFSFPFNTVLLYNKLHNISVSLGSTFQHYLDIIWPFCMVYFRSMLIWH
jgi:hypothetical protein